MDYHAAKSAVWSERCGEAMLLEDVGHAFRDALHVRDNNHAFGIVASVVGFLTGCHVRFESLLVFLDFAHRPFRIAASGQCLICDLFFLLVVLVICDDGVFPIIEGAYDS